MSMIGNKNTIFVCQIYTIAANMTYIWEILYLVLYELNWLKLQGSVLMQKMALITHRVPGGGGGDRDLTMNSVLIAHYDGRRESPLVMPLCVCCWDKLPWSFWWDRENALVVRPCVLVGLLYLEKVYNVHTMDKHEACFLGVLVINMTLDLETFNHHYLENQANIMRPYL